MHAPLVVGEDLGFGAGAARGVDHERQLHQRVASVAEGVVLAGLHPGQLGERAITTKQATAQNWRPFWLSFKASALEVLIFNQEKNSIDIIQKYKTSKTANLPGKRLKLIVSATQSALTDSVMRSTA